MNFEKVVDALVKAKGVKSEAASLLGIARSTFNDRIKGMVAQQEDDNLLKNTVKEFFDYQPKNYRWSSDADYTKNQVIPTLFLSDFHWGEVIVPENVGGINSYDPMIAHERLYQCVSNFLSVCFDDLNYDYYGLVLILGGDMISGDIHDELRETNMGHTSEHVLALFDALANNIKILKKLFKNIYIPCTFGNHGRLTKEYRYKTAAATNMDWLLYNLLAKHFKEDKDITFDIPTSFDVIYKIFDTTYLLTHGDRIGASGGGGILGSLPGILRGMKRIKSNNHSMKKYIDHIVMGHFHTYVVMEDGTINGSLKGPDEYSLGSRFDPEPPRQAMWLTDSKNGITLRMPIYVETSTPRPPTGDNDDK